LALNGDEWLAQCPCWFNVQNPQYQLRRRLVQYEDGVPKRKISTPAGNETPVLWSSSLQPKQYTKLLVC